MTARVVSVAQDDAHRFSKRVMDSIVLVEGIGVEGDSHAGKTVQHRSRVARDPSQPNLRQVHLIHRELLEEVAQHGHIVEAGDLGENILTSGIDLLALPRGTRLHIGDTAIVEVTGLRNPCSQIEGFQPGLLAHMVQKAEVGSIVRKAGVMSVVMAGGVVKTDDLIRIELPEGEQLPLEPV